MSRSVLQAERMHLAGLLEAIQRCVYFLNASDKKLSWPLTATTLEQNKKNIDLFESLAAINERFAKLQDTLGAAMRHSLLLSGESGETFLKVLAFYEKTGVIDSVSSWQLCRTTRNLPPGIRNAIATADRISVSSISCFVVAMLAFANRLVFRQAER